MIRQEQVLCFRGQLQGGPTPWSWQSRVNYIINLQIDKKLIKALRTIFEQRGMATNGIKRHKRIERARIRIETEKRENEGKLRETDGAKLKR